jgi:tetratricopeptide (TPR) repeat protein
VFVAPLYAAPDGAAHCPYLLFSTEIVGDDGRSLCYNQSMNRQARASGPSRASKIPTAWWICALLVLGVAAVYWPVIGYGFVDYDDPEYVSVNPHVMAGLSWPGIVWAFTTFYAANWHPLTWLSYMLDAQLWGSHAGGYHATNVLFHAANTVLLFLLLKRLTSATWRSAFVAALFGFHPLHVESVAWVTERKDVLSTFFFMLTLIAYTRYVTSGKWQVTRTASHPPPVTRHPSLFYWLALFFFALGLMSKPMLVTLPFVLLLLDFWPLNRIRSSEFGVRSFKPLLVEKAPFFVLSAGSCILTFLAQQSGQAVAAMATLPIEMRIQNALIAYATYLEKMLWPDKLAACYPFSPVDADLAAVPVFVLLLISAAVFVFRRQRPWLVTGWLWYLGTLVPVIGLVQVGSQSMADRYTYVPLIGVFIAVTWLVAEITTAWPYRRLVLALLSVGVLAACGKLAAAQVRCWRDSETLARHALAVTTENEPMQLLLGSALIEQGKIEEAGQHFAEAFRISPNSFAALVDLALALDAQGRLEEAVDICRAALKLQPRELKIHYILANTLSQQGNFAEAIAEYQTTLQLDPNHRLALNDLAWLLATAPDARFRNGAEAMRRAEQACRLTDYKLPLFVGTLAAAYAEAGRFDDAVKTAEQAIALATAARKVALVAKNRELLELYQAKKAYHQPTRH